MSGVNTVIIFIYQKISNHAWTHSYIRHHSFSRAKLYWTALVSSPTAVIPSSLTQRSWHNGVEYLPSDLSPLSSSVVSSTSAADAQWFPICCWMRAGHSAINCSLVTPDDRSRPYIDARSPSDRHWGWQSESIVTARANERWCYERRFYLC